jgi:Bacterial SH3 domain
MPSAQHHALKVKLNHLQVLPARTVPYPARTWPDQRDKDLVAKIGTQMTSGRPIVAAPAKQPVPRPPSRAHNPLNSLFDAPTLIVSLAMAGLLVGSAFVTMLWIGAVEAPWSELWSPAPEQASARAILSASAAGATMPATLQQTPPAAQPVHTAALPSQEPNPLDDLDTSSPKDGVGLFGDVRDVFRPDGQSGVTFGAIYDAPNPGSAVTEIPEPAKRARVEEHPVPTEPVQPQAAEDSTNAKWIVLPISVNLRLSPSISAGAIGAVEKGTRLRELDRHRGWVKVTHPETQKTGWLYPNSKPIARRGAKQPVSGEEQSKSGPLVALGDWFAKR